MWGVRVEIYANEGISNGPPAPEPPHVPRWSPSNNKNKNKNNLQDQVGVLRQMTEPVCDKDARAAI